MGGLSFFWLGRLQLKKISGGLVAEAERLCNMRLFNIVGAVQVCDCAGNFDNLEVAASREVEHFGRTIKERLCAF